MEHNAEEYYCPYCGEVMSSGWNDGHYVIICGSCGKYHVEFWEKPSCTWRPAGVHKPRKPKRAEFPGYVGVSSDVWMPLVFGTTRKAEQRLISLVREWE